MPDPTYAERIRDQIDQQRIASDHDAGFADGLSTAALIAAEADAEIAKAREENRALRGLVFLLQFSREKETKDGAFTGRWLISQDVMSKFYRGVHEVSPNLAAEVERDVATIRAVRPDSG